MVPKQEPGVAPGGAEPATTKPKEEPKAAGDMQQTTANSSQNPEKDAYYKLRKTLGELVNKKNSIDRYLEEIEDKIYTEEGVYLQETNAGNIAKGFDQYTKTTQHRRKSVLTEQDRIFSQSSTSFDAES